MTKRYITAHTPFFFFFTKHAFLMPFGYSTKVSHFEYHDALPCACFFCFCPQTQILSSGARRDIIDLLACVSKRAGARELPLCYA
jgi:hypothetical protein